MYEVKQIILDMLVLYNINSSIFHNILSQHFGVHSSRFIREFYSFATSPFEMDQYDRECVLVRPRNSSLSFIVTVGRDDSEDVQVGTFGRGIIGSCDCRVCTDGLGLQVIPSPPLEDSGPPWIDVNRATSSNLPSTSSSFRLLSRLANHSAIRCNHTATTSTSTNPSTSVINLTDSETEDCVILDDAPGPETIVLDDSDNEVETQTTAGLSSSSSSSSSNLLNEDLYVSSQRPLDLTTSRSTSSQTSDPPSKELPSQLPESSGGSFPESRETLVPVKNDVQPNEKMYSLKRRRSCSIDSSVLSTSVSSDESYRCHREKRSKRLCRTRSKRAAAYRRYSSDELWGESSSEDAASESDWEDSRRKRKKKSKKSHTSKREKKVSSKKRKKPTAHKSKKKKPSCGSPGVDGSDHKSRPKREKTKSKRRARTPIEAVDSPRSTGGSKLCSVVKVVHRDSDSFLMDQPSTSSGYRGCDSRNDFVKVNRKSYFVSDSD